MTDIVDLLRQTRANMLGTDDEAHYWTCHDAADEIERLRAILEDLIPSDAMIESRKKIQDAMLHHCDFKTEFTESSKKYRKIYNDLKKNWREND